MRLQFIGLSADTFIECRCTRSLDGPGFEVSPARVGAVGLHDGARKHQLSGSWLGHGPFLQVRALRLSGLVLASWSRFCARPPWTNFEVSRYFRIGHLLEFAEPSFRWRLRVTGCADLGRPLEPLGWFSRIVHTLLINHVRGPWALVVLDTPRILSTCGTSVSKDPVSLGLCPWVWCPVSLMPRLSFCEESKTSRRFLDTFCPL